MKNNTMINGVLLIETTQKQAIENTYKRLKNHSLEHRVVLVEAGHGI